MTLDWPAFSFVGDLSLGPPFPLFENPTFETEDNFDLVDFNLDIPELRPPDFRFPVRFRLIPPFNLEAPPLSLDTPPPNLDPFLETPPSKFPLLA